ncbi:MAG TPA: proton-conducting transporter membrane subunit [Candidatus Binatia bacterium]|nr:proton-conducting transporter membrane subunit [Candidatus Binatia bacterium]
MTTGVEMSRVAESYFSLAPLVAVLISLIAAGFILLSRRRPNLRETWTIVAALCKFTVVSSMVPTVLSGRYPEVTLLEMTPGISLALKADPLGLSFALSASLLWIFTSFYSIGYMRALGEHHQTRYFASFAICLSATMGIAFAANLLTFLIFYEVLTIATYPLVIHNESAAAISAGRKYLAFLLTAGGALLLAVGLTQAIAGSLSFSAGGFLSPSIGQTKLLALFVLFLIGVGAKAGLMPLHSWLPSAMIAPTPVSALLHAVAVVKAGVFGFARVVGFVFGPDSVTQIGATTLVVAVAGGTIILASLLAMAQDNLKRRLAYSTVGHLAYIILGTALASPAGWLGGLFHITTHAAMKITLFFCAGAIYVKTGRENISELDGIGKQMPLTMAAFAVASLGLAGLPPVGGFISKWFLVQGAVESGQLMLLAALLPSGLLNAGYLFPILIRAFFKSSKDFTNFAEAPPLMVMALLSTATFALLLGIYPDGIFYFYSLSSEAVASVLKGVAP